MSIREEIEIQYKKSIIDKNQELTNTLRLIKSAIKDKDIAARSSNTKEEIKDPQILELFQSLVKQRKDSIDSFKLANRQDLVEKEENEIKIISSFLPQQKNEEETKKIIYQIINEKNFKTMKDMGNLMKVLKNTYSGEIDMSLAGKIAKSKLSN